MTLCNRSENSTASMEIGGTNHSWSFETSLFLRLDLRRRVSVETSQHFYPRMHRCFGIAPVRLSWLQLGLIEWKSHPAHGWVFKISGQIQVRKSARPTKWAAYMGKLEDALAMYDTWQDNLYVLMQGMQKTHWHHSNRYKDALFFNFHSTSVRQLCLLRRIALWQQGNTLLLSISVMQLWCTTVFNTRGHRACQGLHTPVNIMREENEGTH